MSDRRNRRILICIGLLLAAGGTLSACLGAGVFGTARSNRAVFDPTVVRWWNEGGWMSFATVAAIGLVIAVLGVVLMIAQLARNDGRTRTPDFAYPPRDDDRGETSIRAAALSHGLEGDLERIPGLNRALVGMFGRYPNVELRVVVDVDDDVKLVELSQQVTAAFDTLRRIAGLEPNPVQVTVRFRQGERDRQLA